MHYILLWWSWSPPLVISPSQLIVTVSILLLLLPLNFFFLLKRYTEFRIHWLTGKWCHQVSFHPSQLGWRFTPLPIFRSAVRQKKQYSQHGDGEQHIFSTTKQLFGNLCVTSLMFCPCFIQYDAASVLICGLSTVTQPLCVQKIRKSVYILLLSDCRVYIMYSHKQSYLWPRLP